MRVEYEVKDDTRKVKTFNAGQCFLDSSVLYMVSDVSSGDMISIINQEIGSILTIQEDTEVHPVLAKITYTEI